MNRLTSITTIFLHGVSQAAAVLLMVLPASAQLDPTFSDADWSSLGGIPGADDIVRAAVVDAFGNLYIGGDFTVAGEVMANGIAKWNGSAWSALGWGMDSHVHALAVAGPDLYAGGRFTNYYTAEGGAAASHIAKWDGSAWSALGLGTNGTVYALAVAGTDLYAGGWFSTAGDKVSGRAARANIGAAPGRFSNMVYSPAAGFSWTFLDATPGLTYRIQSSTSLAAGSWTDFTTFIYTGPIVITDDSAAGTTRKFYRAVTP